MYLCYLILLILEERGNTNQTEFCIRRKCSCGISSATCNFFFDMRIQGKTCYKPNANRGKNHHVNIDNFILTLYHIIIFLNTDKTRTLCESKIA